MSPRHAGSDLDVSGAYVYEEPLSGKLAASSVGRHADAQDGAQGRAFGIIDSKPSPTASLEPVQSALARDSYANRHAVQQVGGAAYLLKPFGSTALLSALDAATRPRS
jgi:hypothetical protein